MRKLRLIVPVALAALFLAAFLHATAHASPRVDTAPSASYAMSDPCHNSECTILITIGSNPSNYNVRAWEQCSDDKVHYGGWHSSGASTAGCGTNGTYGLFAGFEYDKTQQNVVYCWAVGDPRTGSC